MSRYVAFIVFAGLLTVFAGCSSKTESPAAVDDSTSSSTSQKGSAKQFAAGSDEEQIHNMINDALIRLSYGDKSDLYELEYDYFLDDYTFDEYLKMGQITYAKMDSLLRVETDSVMFFGDDSAWAIIEYVFKDTEGDEKSRRKDRIAVYKYQGRWIKPTVSVLPLQMEYQARIDAAKRAAEQEAAEEAAGK